MNNDEKCKLGVSFGLVIIIIGFFILLLGRFFIPKYISFLTGGGVVIIGFLAIMDIVDRFGEDDE